MKNLKLFSFLFAGIAWLAIGCSKGTTGPQGPVGPAGPDSVVHSNWITLNMTKTVSAPGDTIYSQSLSAPAITQRILDSGIILTYLSFVDNNGVTNVFSASAYFAYEGFSPGAIDLISFNDYSQSQYRYVVVPGTIAGGNIVSGPAKGLTKQQLQHMSYGDVIKMVQLASGQVTSQ